MPTRAVITGGAGFLGSHLAERLLDEGAEVLCLDNFCTGRPENVEHLRERPGFRLVRADVTDYIHVTGPVDYVLHFASPASPPDYLRLPAETLKVGSIGTLHALGLARDKGARFLLASTSEVYGDPLVHPQPESYWGNVNSVGPRSVYDEAKRFAESATVAYRTRYGVDTAIMRIFNTYGPRMRADDGRAIPNFIGQALRNEPLTVAGDGLQTRSVCYVDDLISGALALLFSDHAGPVNIGNPQELSMLVLAKTIKELVRSHSPIEFVERPQDDPALRRPVIDLAVAELGWEPKVHYLQGLRRTIDWFAGQRSDAPLAEPDGAPLMNEPVEIAVVPAAATETAGPATLAAAEPAPQRVAVIGTGYVGAVTATCMATLGHQVVGLDVDSERATRLSEGTVPFFEPGLAEQLSDSLATGRLRFTHVPGEALQDADVVFLCVGTPTGSGGFADVSQLESAARTMAPYLRDDVVVVNKSTVPVGSGNWLRTLLEEQLPASARPRFHVVSNPEFLREGSALRDFMHPDRIVLGGPEDGTSRVAALYAKVVSQSFSGGRSGAEPKLIITDLISAEMTKYASNAFLATKISFANEIANICQLVGADARHVLPAVGADDRIGERFLGAGIGWGGSCFGKDLAALIATGQEYGYSPALLGAAVDINQLQRAAVIRVLQRELRVLKGRRIAVLGIAFKPDTDDIRDAPAVDIARRLAAAGAVVSAYDPVVKELPGDLAAVRFSSDAYEAAKDSDAVVIATEWDEFRRLDLTQLAGQMRGTTVFDGRNLLQESDVRAAGLDLVGVGW